MAYVVQKYALQHVIGCITQRYFAPGEYIHTLRHQASLTRFGGICEADSTSKSSSSQFEKRLCADDTTACIIYAEVSKWS